MPPWAAMLCARRGESWNVNSLTRYPSSPSVAAAAAPARPLPTTITSNRRLFAGFTNFTSNLCCDHFSAIGPGGIFASSSPIMLSTPGACLMVRSSAHRSCRDEQRHADVAHRDHDREPDREVPPPDVPARVVEPEALEHAPRAVEDVDAQGQHREDVDDGDGNAFEAVEEVVVGIAAHEVRVGAAPREIEQVEHDEQGDDDAGPSHRARREVGSH